MTAWPSRIESELGVGVRNLSSLAGGSVGDVYAVVLADGRTVVAKVDDSADSPLVDEARMLQELKKRSKLPVPDVLASSSDLLVMTRLPGSTGCSAKAQAHAAEQLAELHATPPPSPNSGRFGFDVPTRIGGLVQPNPWTASWVAFFRDQRLLFMADCAHNSGSLPARTFGRIESLAGKLDRYIEAPSAPALLHGDLWTGNILSQGDRVTGYIDPAVYYGHPEIELAFTTLFGTFGDAFFEPYAALRPLDKDFFRIRRHLYNLYPLLVHVRLFGGSYVAQVENTLTKFDV